MNAAKDERTNRALFSETMKTDKKYILAIDQGTTSSRAILFDKKGQIKTIGQHEHRQIFPKAGWVEHDPQEIWRNVRKSVADAFSDVEVNHHDVAAVGITNQRETAVVWDKNTGKPIYNAIVWQDTRTQAICDELAGDDGYDKYHDRVGLSPVSYTHLTLPTNREV